MTQEINALLDVAYAHLDQQNAHQARQVFEQVVAKAPHTAEAWLMLGALDGEAGNVSAALSNVQRAVELDPEYPEARLTLARLYQSLDRPTEAVAEARRACELEPGDTVAWKALAGLAGLAGDFETAEQAAHALLELDPHSPQTMAILASAQRGLGKLEEAAAGYRRALQQDNGLLEAYIGLGNTLLAMGRPAEALEPLRTAARMAPDQPEIKQHLDVALQSIEQSAAAN